MKKFLSALMAIMLVFVMSIGLVACENNSTGNKDDSSAVEPPKPVVVMRGTIEETVTNNVMGLTLNQISGMIESETGMNDLQKVVYRNVLVGDLAKLYIGEMVSFDYYDDGNWYLSNGVKFTPVPNAIFNYEIGCGQPLNITEEQLVLYGNNTVLSCFTELFAVNASTLVPELPGDAGALINAFTAMTVQELYDISAGDPTFFVDFLNETDPMVMLGAMCELNGMAAEDIAMVKSMVTMVLSYVDFENETFDFVAFYEDQIEPMFEEYAEITLGEYDETYGSGTLTLSLPEALQGYLDKTMGEINTEIKALLNGEQTEIIEILATLDVDEIVSFAMLNMGFAHTAIEEFLFDFVDGTVFEPTLNIDLSTSYALEAVHETVNLFIENEIIDVVFEGLINLYGDSALGEFVEASMSLAIDDVIDAIADVAIVALPGYEEVINEVENLLSLVFAGTIATIGIENALAADVFTSIKSIAEAVAYDEALIQELDAIIASCGDLTIVEYVQLMIAEFEMFVEENGDLTLGELLGYTEME